MAYDYKHKLIIDIGIAYILNGNEKIIISKPEEVRSFWFETWIHLKDFYYC